MALLAAVVLCLQKIQVGRIISKAFLRKKNGGKVLFYLLYFNVTTRATTDIAVSTLSVR